MPRTISLRIGVGAVKPLFFNDDAGLADLANVGLVISSPFTYTDATFTDNGDGTWTSAGAVDNGDGTWSV